MHQVNAGWQQFVQAIAHDSVRLAAANFHQYPLAGDTARNFASQAKSDTLVAVLVYVFHRY
jgi:hypothetical protein